MKRTASSRSSQNQRNVHNNANDFRDGAAAPPNTMVSGGIGSQIFSTKEDNELVLAEYRSDREQDADDDVHPLSVAFREKESNSKRRTSSAAVTTKTLYTVCYYVGTFRTLTSGCASEEKQS